MLEAFAKASSGRRSKWVVIAVWVALTVVFGTIAGNLPERLDDQQGTPASLPQDSDTARLSQARSERFPGGDSFVTLIVYRRPGGLTAADEQRVLQDAEEAAEVEHAGPIALPFGPAANPQQLSPDRSVAFTFVPLLSEVGEERTEALEELREITGSGEGGLSVRVTGGAAFQSDLSTALEAVDGTLLVFTALLVLTLLIAIYRSPIVPFIPLTVVGVSLAISQGLVYLYAEAADVTVDRSATTLLAILVFGAGTDYCLLLVSRYTVNLRQVPDKHDAMRRAIPAAAPAILASGVTVIGALLTTLTGKLETHQILGPVNAIGIAVVLLASLTLLPALLAVVGRRGFWPSGEAVEVDQGAVPPATPRLLSGLQPLPAELRASVEAAAVVRKREGIWGQVGQRVLARPVLAVVASMALLGTAALGVLTYQEDVNQPAQFREPVDSTEGFDLLRTGFPAGALFPMAVLVERENGPPEEAVPELRSRIAEIDGVAAVSDITNRSEDGDAVTFSVTLRDDPFTDPALERAERIREVLEDPATPGTTAIVGDGSALNLDRKNFTSDDQRRIIPLILLVILITLIVLLRALVAPIYLLVTVVISFFASMGASLVAFDVLFGQESVDPSYPLLSFIFLVALGVDYNIFLMSAVREDAAEHGTRPAILRAIKTTGPVITSAGLILAGTFAVLMILPLDLLFQVGFTVALGVLVDTFIVRTITVPAIAWLLGDANWWPSGPAGGARAPAVSGVYRPGPLLEAARRQAGASGPG